MDKCHSVLSIDVIPRMTETVGDRDGLSLCSLQIILNKKLREERELRLREREGGLERAVATLEEGIKRCTIICLQMINNKFKGLLVQIRNASEFTH